MSFSEKISEVDEKLTKLNNTLEKQIELLSEIKKMGFDIRFRLSLD